jgi:MoxR-like ATPase
VLAAVEMVRDSRSHPDLRTGSSVRGAIDFTLVADELATLRGTDPRDPAVTLDAALLALSGRVRVRDGATRSGDDVVRELWERHFGPRGDDADGDGDAGADADDTGGAGKA